MRIIEHHPHDQTEHRLRREATRNTDLGATLVEVMISIALIGLLMGAVVTAVQVSIRSSSTAYVSSNVETVLLNASDRISRAPQVCDYEPYVDAAASSNGWAPSSIDVTVELLVANTGDASDWEPQTCPADVQPFDVQRLTISVTDPTGRITRTLMVVKSDVN